MQVRKRIKDPLLGFGWAGYVASAVLVGIVALLLAGVEVRFVLLKLILNTLGVDAMMYFVARLPFFGFALFGVSLSVLTGVGVLAAFRIAPYRVQIGMQFLIFFLCAVWFIVPLVGNDIFVLFGFGNRIFVYLLLEIFGIALVGAGVTLVSRSILVCSMWMLALALALATALWYRHTGENPPGMIALIFVFDLHQYTLYSLVFDLLTMGSVLLWAVIERKKILPDEICQSCGYDLTGLGDGAICPECGHE